MNKVAFSLALFLIFSVAASAQKQPAKTKALKPFLVLKINREGGANGANIAWHPGQKKYYAAMAGNSEFPMEVFDATGKMVSPDSLQTMFDVRGLWYNPNAKTLQANGYDNYGWSEYKLDAKGIPVSSRKLSVLTSQPDPQSVGAFDPKNNLVYFYDYGFAGVEQHNMKTSAADTTIILHLNARTKDEIVPTTEMKDNYNENAIAFTGIPKKEIGVLNATERQIELYNLANGLMTEWMKLPDDAPVEHSLNFSYCNGIYWLFNKTDREWHGYKYQ
jgi:hypothetical protein